MTLCMRDLENIEIGREQGRQEGQQKERERMALNALQSTKSVKQTAAFLLLEEGEVRKIAKKNGIAVKD